MDYKSGVVISQTLNCMLDSGSGYRTEAYSGSGVRCADDVIRYELSMGNIDIVRFMQTNYEQLKEYQLGDEFFDEIESLDIDEQDEARGAALSDLCQENAPYISGDILKFASDYLGKDAKELSAIWLTTLDKAVSRYGGDLEEIDRYALIKGSFLVISDLGEDGALFVF